VSKINTTLPWEYANSGTIDVIYAKDSLGSDRRVCEMIGPNGEGNAELIVRAVNCHEELLEACKAVRDAAHQAANGGSDGNTIGGLKILLRELRDVCHEAIAKAEGKQP
jgi:hypothetical protein